MEIKTYEEGQIHFIEMSGQLTNQTAKNVLERLLNSIRSSKCKIIAVDFSQITHIDSMGIGTIVYSLKLADEKDFEVVYYGVPEKYRLVFVLFKIDYLVELLPNKEAVLAHFKDFQV